MELVNKHLASEEIEKMVEGSENVIDDSLPPRNDKPQIPDTRLEPRSDKESPKVEITNDEEVEITNVVIPVNVNEAEEEITDEVYELKRREKGKIVEESRSTPFLTPIRSPRTHTNLVSSDTEKLQELTELQRHYTYLFGHLEERFLSRKSFDMLADHLQEVMVESLPTMVDTHIKEQVKNQVPEQVQDQVPVSYMYGHILHVHPAQSQTLSVPEQQYWDYFCKATYNPEGLILPKPQTTSRKTHSRSKLSRYPEAPTYLYKSRTFVSEERKFRAETIVPQTTCRPSVVRLRDQDDPHDDAHPEGENSAKRQKTFEYEAYVSGESSSGQVNEEERGPSTSGNQEQVDDYDFWIDAYASDDDEIPMKQVSQYIMEEVSLTIDEAKLKKMADEMLRQRCTSGDKHQYHIDQMKNFLKSDIVWETRKEILVSPHPRKTTPLVNKCVKKFNPYARYGVEHWKNPHAKIFYIKKQKEPGKPKEEVYSNSNIIQVIKTYWELGYEHKFITKIVARRANECIMSITEPDYKNLNENDIEDMYLLIINGKVPDYAETGLVWSLSVFIRSSVIWERVHDFQLGIESYQQKVNLTTPTISFPGVKNHKMFSIIYEPVHGIIYKNSKKEKRVMRHLEIHKFYDATLNRVLEGLKSYNNDVKYGYVQRELTDDGVEYLKLFEEEIKARLKDRNQMRRWEMYVNGRPLGPRRECPE
ncbi:hypothetical protein Tco_1091581 [Tanacetum coccineum]|uniref:Uncharacterized protein n=1 Tax=Tanacetum coccineum TaxID=301880 RepID=A0ABQ5I7F9_9ASTR